MGIRFLCPNGHKLNVKAALAGKRGICPVCRAKFVIPTVSAAHAAQETAGASHATPSPTDSLSASLVGVTESAAAAPQTTANGVSGAASTSVTDSAARPPSGVWYVRPPGGGQFGPASDAVFRDWIAEGRVTADAHVWREGWPEWKLAQDVGDALPAPLAARPIITAPVVPPAGAAPAAAVSVTTPLAAPPPSGDQPQHSKASNEAPTEEFSIQSLAPTAAGPSPSAPEVGDERKPAVSDYLANRRRANKRQLALAILMILVVIVLLGVLIWVLRRDSSPRASVSQAFQAEEFSLASVRHADSLRRAGKPDVHKGHSL